MDYLGFKLRNNNLLVDPSKIQPVLVWETPAWYHDVQFFFGMINFYRRCIKDYAKIAKGLDELTKNVAFRWSNEAQCSFNALKKRVISAPALCASDAGRDTFVKIDISKLAPGIVPEQNFTEGRYLIPFLSKTLSSAEQKVRSS